MTRNNVKKENNSACHHNFEFTNRKGPHACCKILKKN